MRSSPIFEIASHPPVYILPSLNAPFYQPLLHQRRLPVLRLDKVAEVLGLLVSVVVVTVVIVSVIRRADVLHLVDAAALGATLDGALLGDLSASQQLIVLAISPASCLQHTVNQMTPCESAG